jgi:hypothetical protein
MSRHVSSLGRRAGPSQRYCVRDLLAAVATGDIRGSHGLTDDGGHRSQAIVTDLMAVAVVEKLEMVDIEHQE